MNPLPRHVRRLVAVLTLLGLASVARAQVPLIAKFSTVMGDFDVLLDPQAAPVTVSNFVRYADAGIYDGTFVHRSTTGNPFNIQIIQGGTYFLLGTPPQAFPVPLDAPIPLEVNRSNLRGTIAMARTDAPDSATSGWFFNLVDEPGLDGSGPGTGYAVFGGVLGAGMQNVVDSLGAVPTYNLGGAFSQLPLTFPSIATTNTFLNVFNVDIVPFRITAARRESGGFRVEWPPLSTNTPVKIERSTNLASGSWTVVSSNNTNATFLDTAPPAGAAFYRVVVP